MRSLILLISFFVPSLLFSQQIPKRIKYAGENIGFYEYKPSSYNDDKSVKYPVLIFLHGIGERGNGTSDLWKVKRIAIPHYIDQGHPMRFKKDGKWHSFIVVSPQSPKKYGMWQTSYVDAMIDYAEKHLRIDRNRIYLAGVSMGGGGTWKFVSASEKNAKKIAAFATVCAPPTLSNGCNIAKSNLPMWAFHANDDEKVNVSVVHNAVNKVLACNPAIEPKKTTWPNGGHEVWDRAFDTEHSFQTPNVYEWFLGYSRNDKHDDDDDDDKDEGDDDGKPAPAPPSSGRNQPPVAKAGDDLLIQVPHNSAKLAATSSYDPDGYIKSFKWTRIFGPEEYHIHNDKAGSTEVSGLQAGLYVFRVTVTDSRGASRSDNVNVRVNTPATARAGNDVSITLPSNSVLLNGTSSRDAGGWIKAFRWTKINGPEGSWFANDKNGWTRVNNLSEGKHCFRLMVTDGDGAVSSDEIVITVEKEAVYQVNNAQLDSAMQVTNAVQSSSALIDAPATEAAILTVHPNPASSTVTVTCNTPRRGRMGVTLYDVSGKPVKTAIYEKNEQMLMRPVDISQLYKGIYVVSVSVEGMPVSSQRFVKE